MKRTLMVALSLTSILALAAPALAQTAGGTPATAPVGAELCSLQLAGVQATPEQIEAYAQQAARIETASNALLANHSLTALQAACPTQAALFTASFDLAQKGANASKWTANDQLVATAQGSALAAGFDSALSKLSDATAKSESCAFQCKRERDKCLADDGCTGGWPCFCCVPCNVTWLACLADCCLPG